MSTVAPYNRDLLTAALMGFTAGYTTANTKVRFNTFGGMMTGNTVKVGISLQQREWGWAGVYMACILLFALGTVFALFMIQRLGTNAQRAFLLIFMVSFLLVDGIALALKDEDPIYSSLVSSLAAFALGAQHRLDPEPDHQRRPTTSADPDANPHLHSTYPHRSTFTNPGHHILALTHTRRAELALAEVRVDQGQHDLHDRQHSEDGRGEPNPNLNPNPNPKHQPSPQPKPKLSPSPNPVPKPEPDPSPSPEPNQALWNLATKKGGLKPAEQRGAFLLFLTWINYVIGGVCGASLSGVLLENQPNPTPHAPSRTPAHPLPPCLTLSRSLSPSLTPSLPNPIPTGTRTAAATLTATLTIGSSSTGH